MTWVGLRDGLEGVLAPSGLGRPCAAPPAPDEVMPRGSLWIEFRHEPSDRPVNVLRYTRRDPEPTVLTLRSDPDGGLALLLRRGAYDGLHILRLPGFVPGDLVQAAYLWDSAAGRGAFAARLPESETTVLTEIAAPPPLRWRDATDLAANEATARCAPGVEMLALATHLAPLGPAPVSDGEGLVDTPEGPRPVAALGLGDAILAADGAPAQVRWIGGAETVARGQNGPVLMRAPYLGLTQDLCLGGGALLRLGGTEVEYLFGEAEVAVGLRHLVDRVAILPLDGRLPRTGRAPYSRRLYQIVLDRPVPLSVSGAVVEPLDIGVLLADPVLHRWSLLRGLPAELLPRLAPPACPRLRGYEARTLRQMQAA